VGATFKSHSLPDSPTSDSGYSEFAIHGGESQVRGGQGISIRCGRQLLSPEPFGQTVPNGIGQLAGKNRKMPRDSAAAGMIAPNSDFRLGMHNAAQHEE
jgi:hypothetical protein